LQLCACVDFQFALPPNATDEWWMITGDGTSGFVRDNKGSYYSADSLDGWVTKWSSSTNGMVKVWRMPINPSSLGRYKGGWHVALSLDETLVYAPCSTGVIAAFDTTTGKSLVLHLAFTLHNMISLCIYMD
jgi:hypothetical protein